jgi:hypothetical protein
VAQDLVSGPVRLLHHDGHAHGAVGVEHGLAQVREQVSVVAVQLDEKVVILKDMYFRQLFIKWTPKQCKPLKHNTAVNNFLTSYIHSRGDSNQQFSVLDACT